MVVRKTGLIILTFLYLAFTAGISVQRHYCMNRMASLRFSAHPEERCGFCGMEKTEQDNSCCRDEQVVYKITDDQQRESTGLLKELAYLPLLQDMFLPPATELPFVLCSPQSYAHGPPGIPSVPIFIRFAVFRI